MTKQELAITQQLLEQRKVEHEAALVSRKQQMIEYYNKGKEEVMGQVSVMFNIQDFLGRKRDEDLEHLREVACPQISQVLRWFRLIKVPQSIDKLPCSYDDSGGPSLLNAHYFLYYLAFNPQVKVIPSDLALCFNVIQNHIYNEDIPITALEPIIEIPNPAAVYMSIISHLSTECISRQVLFFFIASAKDDMMNVNATFTTYANSSYDSNNKTNVKVMMKPTPLVQDNNTSSQRITLKVITPDFLDYAATVVGMINPFKLFCNYLNSYLDHLSNIYNFRRSYLLRDDIDKFIGADGRLILSSMCYIYASIPALRVSLVASLVEVEEKLLEILNNSQRKSILIRLGYHYYLSICVTFIPVFR